MKYFNVGFVVFNVVSLVSALHRVYSHRLQHQSALSPVTVVTVRNKTKKNTSFFLVHFILCRDQGYFDDSIRFPLK